MEAQPRRELRPKGTKLKGSLWAPPSSPSFAPSEPWPRNGAICTSPARLLPPRPRMYSSHSGKLKGRGCPRRAASRPKGPDLSHKHVLLWLLNQRQLQPGAASNSGQVEELPGTPLPSSRGHVAKERYGLQVVLSRRKWR